jgi:hypothetical protein
MRFIHTDIKYKIINLIILKVTNIMSQIIMEIKTSHKIYENVYNNIEYV